MDAAVAAIVVGAALAVAGCRVIAAVLTGGERSLRAAIAAETASGLIAARRRVSLAAAMRGRLRQYVTLRALVHRAVRARDAARAMQAIAGNTLGAAVQAGRLALSRRRRKAASGSGEIVMLVVSDLRIDPRVEREARALAMAGFPVKVVFPDISLPRIADQPLNWGAGVTFRPLPLETSAYVMDCPWLFGNRLFRAACQERPLAFHCHDLTTTLIGLAAARRVGVRCVCDFHEWFSENVSWNSRAMQWRPHHPARRRYYRTIERLALLKADGVVTVCDSIARELEWMGRHRTKVRVVRNIPELGAVPTRSYAPIKQELRIAAERFLLLYQGGTGPTRLLEPVIEALALVPDVIFVIRGPSLDLFGGAYRALAEKCGVDDRLILLPPVPSRDVVAAARGADAGLYTVNNLCKNFYYALPNKIFEYMAAGVPILTADFPEAAGLVAAHDIGLCFDPYDPASIAAQIRRLVAEPELAAAMRRRIPQALSTISAGREWHKLVELYDRFGNKSAVSKAA